MRVGTLLPDLLEVIANCFGSKGLKSLLTVSKSLMMRRSFEFGEHEGTLELTSNAELECSGTIVSNSV